MKRFAGQLATMTATVVLITAVTAAMAIAAYPAADGSGPAGARPGDVAVRNTADVGGAAMTLHELWSHKGVGSTPPTIHTRTSQIPLIEESIRYWADGSNSGTNMDLERLTLAINEQGRLSIEVEFYPGFSADTWDASDALWLLLDADDDVSTGYDFAGILGVENVIAFEKAGGLWDAVLYRTPRVGSWSAIASYNITRDGDTMRTEISPSKLHNSERLTFLLASLDYPLFGDPVVDFIPSAGSVGVYEIDEDWITPTTTTSTTLPATTTTLPPTTTTTLPPTTTTTLPSPTFVDVPFSHPYAVQINDMASRGVVLGYGGGRFGPDDRVTRQQFAKMVVLGMGYPVSEADVCPFRDVDTPPDNLYPDNYVAVCAARGITVGVAPGQFAPWNSITRAQLITMVARAAGVAEPPAGYSPPFGDFSDTHYPWARKAAYAGLLVDLQGMGADYDFWAPATRGEVCVMLYNLLYR